MRRLITAALSIAAVVALPAGTAVGVSRILDGSVTPIAGAPDGRPDVLPSPTKDPTSPPPTAEPQTPEPTPPAPAPSPSADPSAPSPAPALPAPPAPPQEDDPIVWAQTQLTELGYYVGAVDGLAGPATAAATMAFQKVNDLPRTGQLDDATLLALEAPLQPELKGGAPDRIEVDLDRQILVVVKADRIVRILPVSSGNGEGYIGSNGAWSTAQTPTGSFTVTRKIVGERHAALGTLYNPLYFYNGFAIHGSPSVPAHEASHGCVRVTITDSLWLSPRIEVGTQILVFGGTHVFPVN